MPSSLTLHTEEYFSFISKHNIFDLHLFPYSGNTFLLLMNNDSSTTFAREGEIIVWSSGIKEKSRPITGFWRDGTEMGNMIDKGSRIAIYPPGIISFSCVNDSHPITFGSWTQIRRKIAEIATIARKGAEGIFTLGATKKSIAHSRIIHKDLVYGIEFSVGEDAIIYERNAVIFIFYLIEPVMPIHLYRARNAVGPEGSGISAIMNHAYYP